MQTILIVCWAASIPTAALATFPASRLALSSCKTLSSLLKYVPQYQQLLPGLIWGAALIAVLIINYVTNKRKAARLLKASK